MIEQDTQRSTLSDDQWTDLENTVKLSYKVLVDLRNKLNQDQQWEVYRLWYAIDYIKDCLQDIELDDNGYFDNDDCNDDYAISDDEVLGITQLRSTLSDDQWVDFENTVKLSYKVLTDLRNKLNQDQQWEVYRLWYAIDYIKDCLWDIELAAETENNSAVSDL